MSDVEFTGDERAIFDLAAEEILKPNGWCQNELGDYTSPEGPVCAAGAIRRVLHILNMPWRGDTDFLLNRALDGSLPDYNDRLDMTAERMAKTLRSL